MLKLFIKFQTNTNTLKNNIAALNSVEIVLLLVASVVMMAILFAFANAKVIPTANSTGDNMIELLLHMANGEFNF